MRWPIGAHWCQRAWREARGLGLSFAWLNADGLSDDPRSREIADTDGWLASDLSCVLTFHLSSEARLRDTAGLWTGYVEATRDRLQALGALDRVLAVQLDDEWYTRLATASTNPRVFPPQDWPTLPLLSPGPWLMYQAAPLVAARAETVRRIFGRHVGAGVGMAETGAYLVPLDGLDWLGCNFYLRSNPVFPDAPTIHRYYQMAARRLPIMPVFEVGADHGRPAPDLGELAATYLPVLHGHQARIWAVGLFSLHHPSQWDGAHGEGRGVLELGASYTDAVRWLTSAYGRDGQTPATAR